MEKVMESEIVKREVLTFGKIKIEELTIKNGDNEFKKQVIAPSNGVGALVYNTETKKYLFVEQYRPATDGVMVEIVAGKLEIGEKTQEAIKREIVEELGYKSDFIQHITDFYVSPGMSKEVIALFYVEVSEKIGDGGGIGNEKINVIEAEDLGLSGNLFMSIPESGDLVPPYKLIDAKSLIAVNWYVQNKMMKSLWETVSDFKMKSL